MLESLWIIHFKDLRDFQFSNIFSKNLIFPKDLSFFSYIFFLFPPSYFRFHFIPSLCVLEAHLKCCPNYFTSSIFFFFYPIFRRGPLNSTPISEYPYHYTKCLNQLGLQWQDISIFIEVDSCFFQFFSSNNISVSFIIFTIYSHSLSPASLTVFPSCFSILYLT